MTSPVITVEGLSKHYQIGALGSSYGRLTESVSNLVRRSIGRGPGSDKKASIWALRDISFEVLQGEVLGIIGSNGAGKTTLLKILSRITEPTEGRAVLEGRVGSLLEVGTGFHPELSGRENIFLNGAVLGMRRRETQRRFDDIVEFSGVAAFLDTPVKRYSSGMYMRLAFAVAAHLEPEILVVDEVLAVGDAAFQQKCIGKMSDVARSGRTVLFVSHNMAAVQSLCTRALLLERGEQAATGPVQEIMQRYLDSAASGDESDLRERTDRHGDGSLRFVDAQARSTAGTRGLLQCGGPGEIRLRFEALHPHDDVHVSITISTLLGETILWLSNELVGAKFDELGIAGEVVCEFDRLPLLPGRYSVTLMCAANSGQLDYVQQAMRFDVVEGDFFGTGKLPPGGFGSIVADHGWRVIEP